MEEYRFFYDKKKHINLGILRPCFGVDWVVLTPFKTREAYQKAFDMACSRPILVQIKPNIWVDGEECWVLKSNPNVRCDIVFQDTGAYVTMYGSTYFYPTELFETLFEYNVRLL